MDQGICAAARLPESDRKGLAIQALARLETVSDLAVRHGVSRRERAIDRAHLHGIVPRRHDPDSDTEAEATSATMPPPGIELLRPLAEYEQVAGGGW